VQRVTGTHAEGENLFLWVGGVARGRCADQLTGGQGWRG
jgi:hypothetical protein